ncbi:MAG TPA: TonB-dependent receptor plug domain-containing protein [Gemmatimonadaceae bacterium]|nr:TonB-dependent receptor plug domain-containing protein [Gemmatimonadaceae bacterium]
MPRPSGRAIVAAAAVVAGCALVGCARGGASAPPARKPAPEAEGGAGRSMQGEGTGSVGVVDGDRVRGIPTTHVEELLAGRVAGVQVVQLPGGGISVKIRGATSFNSSTEPLYVVDGMPVQVDRDRGLDWLNPADLLRIEILKDASATSMYGVQGANGVVLITTRRGKRAAKPE